MGHICGLSYIFLNISNRINVVMGNNIFELDRGDSLSLNDHKKEFTPIKCSSGSLQIVGLDPRPLKTNNYSQVIVQVIVTSIRVMRHMCNHQH